MSFDQSLQYKIALGLIPGIGPIAAKNLIAYTGGPERIFSVNKSILMKTPGVGAFLAEAVIKNKQVLRLAEKEIEYIQKNNIKTLFYTDAHYPFLLKQCPDAPLILYVKGDLDLNNRKLISIVGTRNATTKGKEICTQLVNDFSDSGHNPIIVSGLAYGIDITAHKAALQSGLDTVAVIAHGFDQMYPRAHNKTAQQIADTGAVVSEFTSESLFERQNFLRRNRIIAGLAHAVIVVESAKKGGALVTADIANSYNREVFAVPGRLEDTYSEGCNHLIKTHKAFLMQTIKDVEYILNWENLSNKVVQKSLFIELSDDEKHIASCLTNNDKAVIDLICKETGFNMSKVSALLLEMEFKGAVRSLPGKMYELSGKISSI